MLKRVIKWTLVSIGAIAGVVLLLVATTWLVSGYRLGRRMTVRPAALAVRTDSAALRRGQHLAIAIGKCAVCHGADLGGSVAVDEPMFGRYVGPNLTPGGAVAAYSTEDWVRAIRHGLRPDGRKLVFMPSHHYNSMSSEDLAALIAYLRQLPAVQRALPASQPRTMARALYLFGAYPLAPAERIAHQAPLTAAPRQGVTAEYGRYLMRVGLCYECHGDRLDARGGMPGTPAIHNGALADWTEQDFLRAMRQGKRPDGRVLASAMPWMYIGRMTDDELRAVWAALRETPAPEAAQ